MRNWFLALTIFLTSCQLAPTKINETRAFNIEDLKQSTSLPLRLSEGTLVIDARSSFDFSMAHIPGSLNLHWEDFSQIRSRTPGVLQDFDSIARRLAIYGISPASKIIVVGNGKSGAGEEGRLAWMLYYLGVRNVQFACIDLFKNNLSNIATTQRPNATYWKPQIVEGFEAERAEIVRAATIKEEDERKKVHIIDVRSKSEYFQKTGLGQGYKTPDLRAIHIDWKEFFTSDGRPDFQMLSRLKEIAIQPKDRLLIISNKGVRSAAVAMALLSIGMTNVASYSGGYAELINNK